MDKIYFSKLSNREDFPDDMRVLESKVAADLSRKLAIAIEALEYYADDLNWYNNQLLDDNDKHEEPKKIARQALEKITAIRKY